MLLGALTASWLGPRLPRRQVYSVGFLLSGAPSFAMLAASGTVLPVALVFAACGIAGGAINPILGAVQYERVSARHQARVLGAVKASAWAGMPLGPALAGALATTLGLQATLMAGASLFLILTLTPFFFPAWRQLNNAQTPRAEAHAHGNGA
jgi:MFS family permease